MTMRVTLSAISTLALFALTACGGAGGGGGSSSSTPPIPTEPTGPAIEVTGSGFVALSVRNGSTDGQMAYVLLKGANVERNDEIVIDYSNGVLSGGDLAGRDIDEGIFSNPAGGEFSRVFEISAQSQFQENLFGVVGLDFTTPDAGTVTTIHNEGWVGMQAIFADRTLTLEGDATFTATWGTSDLSGRFFNLTGQDSLDSDVRNVGTIVLTGANISNDEFVGGRVTGTGVFAGLGASSNTVGTRGFFFGPEADELGGVLKINNNSGDVADDIQVIGAFQAD